VSRLLESPVGGLTYAATGVDVAAGDDFVRRIAGHVRSTARDGVLGELGGFSGLFSLEGRYRDPVLVASADGVGTKLEVARLVSRYDTVGIDLVAMLVDDLACVGAEPLFLLDYLCVGRVDAARLEQVVAGVARGCATAGAALLGGETAEHGSLLREDDLDLAGFAVGALERGEELGAHRVRTGDVIIGLGSPGLRSNGYSLARRVLIDDERRLDEPAYEGAARTLADELLLPSVIYSPAVIQLRRELAGALRAGAHVTGGGIVGNVPRALPEGARARIDMGSFSTPEIFFEIQRRGHVAPDEMVRVFNCGLGMALVVDPDGADAAVSIARSAGHDASVIGEVVPGERGVDLA
jgi:phosphoribosylformylglycinamidine cyclo-ligase